MANAIELERVTKRFGDFVAVHELDLAVPEGAVYGFIGPNGSGKTTTLRMILRILYPEAGCVTVLGQAEGNAADDRVGYLPEERGLYQKMRVREVLKYFARLKGFWRCGPEIDQWLERFELARWADKRVDALSKGMAQKVQFIIALIARPKLLVLDEPFAGLDPVNMETFKDAVRAMHKAGTTVVLSTHDMGSAERMCDMILMIFHGKKVLDGTLQAIQARFGEDTIRVRTAEPEVSFNGLPGVVHVNDYRRYKELRIDRAASPRAILEELLRRATIDHFEIARPSLQDIFVRIAGPKTSSTGEENDA